MPLPYLMEFEAPSTSPASGVPHKVGYAVVRGTANDPVWQVWKGPESDPANKVLEIDKDGDVTLSGTIDGVDLAAFKASYDAFVAAQTESVQDIVGALIQDSSTIDATYNDAGAIESLAVIDNTSTQKVRVAKAGVLVGTRREINLIEGTNVTLTVADDAGSDQVDVTITAASGLAAIMARAYRATSNQAIGAGVDTKIQFNAETADPQGFFDAVTNSRFQPTTAGWYRVKGQYTEDGGDTFTGTRRIAIFKNGAEYSRVTRFLGSSTPTIDIDDLVYLNGTTDYAEIFANGGDAMTILLGSTLTFATFEWVGS